MDTRIESIYKRYGYELIGTKAYVGVPEGTFGAGPFKYRNTISLA